MGIKGLFRKVFDANEREIKRMMPVVESINALSAEMALLTDSQLEEKTENFLERLSQGETLDDILPEAFAVVREASRRTIGLVHYDVQLVGGMLLHQGKIVEMKTGEGKTLVATLPLYLNALLLKGSHLVTPNDYLSKVGAQWMGPVYHSLGLSVGIIQSSRAEAAGGSFLFDPEYISDDERYQNLRPCTRQEAYRAHITYGTNHEFGFDYLRDNMVVNLSQCVQREMYYAIVDEIDNILIDEARTPLIISGPADEASPYYRKFAQLVRMLHPSSERSIQDEDPDGDYVYDLRSRNVYLTDQGIIKIQSALGVENLYGTEHSEMLPYLDNALQAHVVYQLDKDYVVNNGEIIIVDSFTGRMMYGRRYSEGLHQAIEAKEGVQVRRENLTHATITYQNFFRMYEKLAGMTGTAATEGEEFEKIYSLDVTILPTNVQYRAEIGELETTKNKENGAEVITYSSKDNNEIYFKRIDYPDTIYATEQIKFDKVVEEIENMHHANRPVLVGTAAIETSERVSSLLKKRGIPHEVLNAKYHEREAVIIAQAGRPGSVTIATNMAGRGVDILLGGNPEALARDILRKEGIEVTTSTSGQWNEAVDKAKAECKADREMVWKAGGLHVIGTERHEARRIDNQLRGRAGRQGDPGSSRFYLSLEDELFRRFGGERLKGFLKQNMGDAPIELGLVSKSVEQSQTRVEGYNFDIRKRVLDYDEVVNEQRRIIYEQRKRVLELQDLGQIILEMANAEIEANVPAFTQGFEEDWDLEGLAQEFSTWLPLPSNLDLSSSNGDQAAIIEKLCKYAAELYKENVDKSGQEVMRGLLKQDRRLDQLVAAESPPGFYNFLKGELNKRLPASLWTQIEVGTFANLGRDDKDKVQSVIGKVMTFQRDRSILLRTVDTLWIRHLTDLDILREGIGLRAYAQQDPLVAFKKDAHEMYGDLLVRIRQDVVRQAFRPPPTQLLTLVQPRRQLFTNRGGDSEERARPVRRSKQEPGRNDPCPCGSGLKYKACCMRKDRVSEKTGPSVGGKPQGARKIRKRRR
ncbi:MAG: preprotein translocase subunit SecA [Anaerolineales bacterium]|nr:preprotein translocase subunit SecA [Anaerolineales bacterium]